MTTNTIDFENLTWISNWHELPEEEKQEAREMFKKFVEEAEEKEPPMEFEEIETRTAIWFKKGYDMSQMDDPKKAKEDPNYVYISCLEEALCCIGGLRYEWEEDAFTRGYLSGC